MANRDPEAEKAIIGEYQSRKQRLEDTLRKGQEISAEIAEHDVVLKTLEPMDAGRKVIMAPPCSFIRLPNFPFSLSLSLPINEYSAFG
jgi:hypothetical protein